jgi:hypothetical protein
VKVIEESNRETTTLVYFCLAPLCHLSHTSILYYCIIKRQKYLSNGQIVSKNKKRSLNSLCNSDSENIVIVLSL